MPWAFSNRAWGWPWCRGALWCSQRCRVCSVLSGVDRSDAPRVRSLTAPMLRACSVLVARRCRGVDRSECVSVAAWLADATLSRGVARFKTRFHIGASSWGWVP